MKHKLVFFFFFLAVLAILSFGVTPGYYNATPPNENDNTTSLLGKILYALNNGIVTSGTAPSGVTQVGGKIVMASGTITRPSTTGTYSTNQLLTSSTSAGTYVQFTVARSGTNSSGYITAANLVKSGTTTTNAGFTLYLSTTGTATVPADAAAFGYGAVPASETLNQIAFSTFATGGTNSTASYSAVTGTPVPFVCSGTDTKIYGRLVTSGSGYGQTSGETFTITLFCDQN